MDAPDDCRAIVSSNLPIGIPSPTVMAVAATADRSHRDGWRRKKKRKERGYDESERNSEPLVSKTRFSRTIRHRIWAEEKGKDRRGCRKKGNTSWRSLLGQSRAMDFPPFCVRYEYTWQIGLSFAVFATRMRTIVRDTNTNNCARRNCHFARIILRAR